MARPMPAQLDVQLDLSKFIAELCVALFLS